MGIVAFEGRQATSARRSLGVFRAFVDPATTSVGGRIVCHNCRNTGHFQRNCPVQFCSNCRHYSHTKNKCPLNRGGRLHRRPSLQAPPPRR
jgi:hypothetical protein